MEREGHCPALNSRAVNKDEIPNRQNRGLGPQTGGEGVILRQRVWLLFSNPE